MFDRGPPVRLAPLGQSVKPFFEAILPASVGDEVPDYRLRVTFSSDHLLEIDDPYRYTFLRFHIYPDGGVSRLRLFGQCA